MSRRYDQSTTTFSPEGRLHQVEYAIEAINNAGTCVGLQSQDVSIGSVVIGSASLRGVTDLAGRRHFTICVCPYLWVSCMVSFLPFKLS